MPYGENKIRNNFAADNEEKNIFIFQNYGSFNRTIELLRQIHIITGF